MFETIVLQTSWAASVKSLAKIDYIIIGLFLLGVLRIATSHFNKSNDIEMYAVGDRNFTPLVLLATLLGTLIGAKGTVEMAPQGFTWGLGWPLITVGATGLIYLFISYFVAPRLYVFATKKDLTIGDMMYRFFGPFGRYVTSVSGVLFYLGLIAMNLLASGILLNAATGIDQNLCLIIISALVITYCALGGIEAISSINLLQFLMVVIAVPFSCIEIIHQSGGIINIAKGVPDNYIYFWERAEFDHWLWLGLLWLVPSYEFGPAIVQRFLMTKDPEDLAKNFRVCAMFTVPFILLIALVGVAALKMEMPSSQGDYTLIYMIMNYTPPFITGITIAGLLAILMSAADSMLNASAVLITHDIANSISQHIKGEDIDELRWARWATLGVGATSAVIALFSDQLLNIALNSILLWQPIVVIPFLASILGLKAKAEAFKASTISVLVVGGVVLLFTPSEEFYVRLVYMLTTNIIVFFGTHFFLGPREEDYPLSTTLKGSNYEAVYITGDGTLGPRGAPLQQDYTQFRIFMLWLMRSPILLGRGIVSFSRSHVNYFGTRPIEFCIFCLVFYLFPYVTTYPTAQEPYLEFLTPLRISICGLASILVLYNHFWPALLRPYFPLLWHFTIMYGLVFYTTFTFFLQNGNLAWIINAGIAIFLMTALVDVISFIVLTVVGVTLGIFAADALITQPLEVATDFNSMRNLIYLLAFAIAIGLIFNNHRKELSNRHKVATMKMFGNALTYELHPSLSIIERWNTIIDTILMAPIKDNHLTPDGKNKEGEKIYKLDIPLDEQDYNMLQTAKDAIVDPPKTAAQRLDILTLSVNDEIPVEEKGLYSLKNTIKEAIASFSTSPEDRKRIVFNEDFEDIYYYSSQKFMTHVFYNLIQNAFKHALASQHFSTLDIFIKGRKIYIRDSGPGISKNVINKVFDKFYTTSKTGMGTGLAFCQMVMHDLGGSIACKSKEQKYTEIILTFPNLDELTLANLRKPRPPKKAVPHQNEDVLEGPAEIA
jgi:Na+/proline symporter/signal transduction histidine kinase